MTPAVAGQIVGIPAGRLSIPPVPPVQVAVNNVEKYAIMVDTCLGEFLGSSPGLAVVVPPCSVERDRAVVGTSRNFVVFAIPGGELHAGVVAERISRGSFVRAELVDDESFRFVADPEEVVVCMQPGQVSVD